MGGPRGWEGGGSREAGAGGGVSRGQEERRGRKKWSQVVTLSTQCCHGQNFIFFTAEQIDMDNYVIF